MKIFDCFMFFDENVILDVRLNILNQFVDYFVIVESRYNHNGHEKDLNFDINKYKNFKDKIIYIIHENVPKEIKRINKMIVIMKKMQNIFLTQLSEKTIKEIL